LPPLNGASHLTSYTLGYDSYTDNYKIIASTYCYRGNNRKQVVNIHTLGTDYWRKVQEDFPCHYYYVHSQPGVFFNENVNWLATPYDDRSLRVIVSFDLKKETYQKPLHCK
jgi:F-box interacting protein